MPLQQQLQTTQNVSITSAKKHNKGTYVYLLDVMSHVMNIKVVSTEIGILILHSCVNLSEIEVLLL